MTRLGGRRPGPARVATQARWRRRYAPWHYEQGNMWRDRQGQYCLAPADSWLNATKQRKSLRHRASQTRKTGNCSEICPSAAVYAFFTCGARPWNHDLVSGSASSTLSWTASATASRNSRSCGRHCLHNGTGAIVASQAPTAAQVDESA